MGINHMRTMYLATARATMEYGTGAWWKGQKTYANAFDNVHEQAFRKMGGHFRSGPGGTVLNEARCVSTAVQLDYRNHQRFMKAVASGESSMIRQCEEDLDDNIALPPPTKTRGMLRATAAARTIVGPRNKIERWGKQPSTCGSNIVLVINGSSEEEIREQKRRKENFGKSHGLCCQFELGLHLILP